MATCLAFVLSPATSSSAVNGTAKKACCGNKMVFYKEVVPVDGSNYTTEAVGQVRVSNGDLQDSDGNRIGEFASNHTIMAITAVARTIQNVAHLEFYGNNGYKKGKIITQGLDVWITGLTLPESGATNKVPIMGGTAACSGVTGTQTQTLLTRGYYKTVLKFKNK
jgi:hypothetical protein